MPGNLLISLDIEEMVDFLGYRNDIENLLKISDLAVASSLREGLAGQYYGGNGLWVAGYCY